MANSSPYFGGGLSFAGSSFGGRGLQGELSVGYELGRATSLRVFVQADAALPFFNATYETYLGQGQTVVTGHRYAPLVSVSVGLGWRKGR